MKRIYSLDPGDIELLIAEVPKYPCHYCRSDSFACCGCDMEKAYQKEIEEYKKRGLIEIAQSISGIRELDEKILELQKKKDKINKQLIEKIGDDAFDKIFPGNPLYKLFEKEGEK